LIESFKSTLDEIRESDLLLHVVDASHPDFEDQIKTVNETLSDIGAGEKPVILVLNKIDLLTDEALKKLRNQFKSSPYPIVMISAAHRINLDELRTRLYNEVRKIHVKRYPKNDFLYPDLEI
jgi:GTP-binding protein HflX